MSETIEKRKLSELRVVDLKQELEKRGKDGTGVKNVLLERLTQVLKDENKDPETYEFEICSAKTPAKKGKPTTGSGSKSDEADEGGGGDGDEDDNAGSGGATKGNSDGKQNGLDKSKEKSSATGAKGDQIGPLLVTIKEEKDADNEDSLNLTIGEEEEKLLQDEEGDKRANDADKANESASKDTSNKADGSEKTTNADGKESSGGKSAEKSTTATSTGGTESDKQANKSASSGDKQSSGSPATASRNLWVSGLASLTRATDLKTLFSKYGKVIGAKVVTNTRTPGTRCYGYVTMASAKDASECITHLHRTELHGRMISVERAKAEIGGTSTGSTAKTGSGQSSAGSGKDAANKSTDGGAEKGGDANAAGNKTDGKDKDTDKDGKGKDRGRPDTRSEQAKAQNRDKSKGPEKGGKDDKSGAGKNDRKPPHANNDAGRRRASSRDRDDRFNNRGGPQPGQPRRGGMIDRRRHSVHQPSSRPGRPDFPEQREVLSLQKIREERELQRFRERERLLREEERRRREARARQREEEEMLRREREKLAHERARIEKEKAELLRIERERQKLEREKIELERLELKRQQRKIEEAKRILKRPATGDPHFENDRAKRVAGSDRNRFEAPPPPSISSQIDPPLRRSSYQTSAEKKRLDDYGPSPAKRDRDSRDDYHRRDSFKRNGIDDYKGGRGGSDLDSRSMPSLENRYSDNRSGGGLGGDNYRGASDRNGGPKSRYLGGGSFSGGGMGGGSGPWSSGPPQMSMAQAMGNDNWRIDNADRYDRGGGYNDRKASVLNSVAFLDASRQNQFLSGGGGRPGDRYGGPVSGRFDNGRY